jgi:hypothetical protein
MRANFNFNKVFVHYKSVCAVRRVFFYGGADEKAVSVTVPHRSTKNAVRRFPAVCPVSHRFRFSAILAQNRQFSDIHRNCKKPDQPERLRKTEKNTPVIVIKSLLSGRSAHMAY